MQYQDGFFFNQHIQSIYYQTWQPDTKIRGLLILVHGLHDHSGRYQHFAEYFTAKGFAVNGFDLFGHGKSQGTRSYVERFSIFTDTLSDFVKNIRGSNPDLPAYLVGHSMGGLVSSAYLVDHQKQVSGAILSGSLVTIPDYITNFTIKVGKLISSLVPKLRLVGIDPEGLSRDTEIVKAYQDDPLVFNGKSTSRISSEINNGISFIAEKGSRINCPVLILHGGADPIVNPTSSQFLFNLVTSSDKQIIIYPDYLHEIYNELGHEIVFQDVLSWLNDRIS